MKSYLKLWVTRHNGTTFENPLKLSEAYLISRIAKDNAKVEVNYTICSPERYKSIFG
jgi:hypothetical protein